MALAPSELRWLEQTVGESRRILAGAVAQLHLASLAPGESGCDERVVEESKDGRERQRSGTDESCSSVSSRTSTGNGSSLCDQFPELAARKGWVFTRVAGALLLVEDVQLSTLLFMLVDMADRVLRFQFELYEDISYEKLSELVHSFEIEQCVAGFRFSSPDAAESFFEQVQRCAPKAGSTNGSDAGPSAAASPLPGSGVAGGKTAQAVKPRRRKRDYIFSKLAGRSHAHSTEDAPAQPRGPGSALASKAAGGKESGFDISRVPAAWKQIFRQAGIRKSDLNDPAMSSTIQAALASAGVETRNRTVTRTYDRRLGADLGGEVNKPRAKLPVVRIRHDSVLAPPPQQPPPPPPPPPPPQAGNSVPGLQPVQLAEPVAREAGQRSGLDAAPPSSAYCAGKPFRRPPPPAAAHLAVDETASSTSAPLAVGASSECAGPSADEPTRELHENQRKLSVGREPDPRSGAQVASSRPKSPMATFLAEITARSDSRQVQSTPDAVSAVEPEPRPAPKLGPASFLDEIKARGQTALKQQPQDRANRPPVAAPTSFLDEIKLRGASGLKPASAGGNGPVQAGPDQEAPPAAAGSRPGLGPSLVEAIQAGTTLRRVAPQAAPTETPRPSFLNDIVNGVVRLRSVSQVKALPALDSVEESAQMSLLAKLKQCVVERRAQIGEDECHGGGASAGGDEDDEWSEQDWSDED